MSDQDFRTKILLADDDALTRRLLVRALQTHGYEIIECQDGTEALQIIENLGPVLLVVDYEMPELNGAQVCELVRLHSDPQIASMPIILLTGHSGEEHEVESLEAGADDFVTKPVNIPILKARIDTQIRLHELRAQLQQQNAELEEWRHRHESDLEAASLTQQAILPQRPPLIEGWEAAAIYRPVIQVGGDIFDWLRTADGSWLFWIADATGHGVSAALLTTLTKLLFRYAAAEAHSACEILDLVNSGFHAIFKGRSFMSAACLTLRAGNSRMCFAGAGHPPLLIRRLDGTIETLRSESPPIGIRPALGCEERCTAVHLGDTVILYTDGLYSMSHPDGERLVPDEICAFFPASAGSAAEFLQSTFDSAALLVAGGHFPDDVAAIALRRN